MIIVIIMCFVIRLRYIFIFSLQFSFDEKTNELVIYGERHENSRSTATEYVKWLSDALIDITHFATFLCDSREVWERMDNSKIRSDDLQNRRPQLREGND